MSSPSRSGPRQLRAPRAGPPRRPSRCLQEGRYRVRLAREIDELRALQRLRFEVFNRELGEGLPSAWETGRDEDRFDAGCDHLLVEEVATANPSAPTGYRPRRWRPSPGFYSDASSTSTASPPSCSTAPSKLGRACVARDHRNGACCSCSGAGSRVTSGHRLRYFFGCASVASQEPAEGIALYRQLAAEGRLHPTARVTPRPGFACRTVRTVEPPELPALFRIYLRRGAQICGEPAIDREFGTLDFLVLLDVAAMDDKHYRTFFG